MTLTAALVGWRGVDLPLLHSALARQASPPGWVAMASFVAAAALVGTRRGWRLSRHAITMAHEGGHAVVGLLARRRLASVRLRSDASGVTVTSGRPSGPGVVATIAAGYVVPSLLGLGAAWLVAARHTTALLVCTSLLLVGMVTAVRNPFGLLTVIVGAAVSVLAAWFGSSTLQSVLAGTLTWFLLFAGPRPIWELHRSRRGRRARLPPTSDADQLAAMTHVPGVVWVAMFGLVALAALAVGARWLVLTVR